MSLSPTTAKEFSVAKATGTIFSLTLVSRILGMVRDAVIARFFGAGLQTDAFYAAFKIPNLLRRLVAEGSLSTAFVPVFSVELHRSPDEARAAVAAVKSFLLLVTICAAVLILKYSGSITLFLAPGWASTGEKTHLAAALLQIMAPYIVLVSFLALDSSILNCLGYFAWPASAQAILNSAIILFVVSVSAFFARPIEAVAWAVIIGGIFAWLPQVFLLRRLGFPLRLRSPFRSPAVTTLVKLMAPTLISSSMYQAWVLISTILASLLMQGSVSWLYYADRLFQFPLGIFSLAVAQAILPSLSRLAAAGENQRFDAQLQSSLHWISYVTIPASIGLIVLSEPIIQVIYQGGTFSSFDTAQTAVALQAFSIGLWAISGQAILVRAFIAKRNTLLPALVASLSLVLTAVFALFLMGPTTASGASAWGSFVISLRSSFGFLSLGHSGLALAGSLGSLLSLTLLLCLLGQAGIQLSPKSFARCVLKCGAAGIAMAASLKLLMAFSLSALATIALGIPLGMSVFFVASYGMAMSEASECLVVVRARLSAAIHAR